MLDPMVRKVVQSHFRVHDHSNYVTDFFNHIGMSPFIVHSGVLGPDKSPASRYLAQYLFDHPELYREKIVCQMGCGSGVQAVLMAKYGAERVVATDILDRAIWNTLENSKLHKTHFNLEERKGDLFESVKGEEYFDLVVFNPPAYQGRPLSAEPISYALLDRGSLLRKFLLEAPAHLSPSGKVVMVYPNAAGRLNDPAEQASNYGMQASTLMHIIDNEGDHSIYELRPKKNFKRLF